MVNNPRKAQGTDQLKVWPTNANRSAFAAVMSPDGPPPGHVDDPNNRIDEAFAYFAGCVADYLTGADDDEADPTVARRGADDDDAAVPRAPHGCGSRCATC